MKTFFVIFLCFEVKGDDGNELKRIKEKYDNSTAQMIIYGYGKSPQSHPANQVEEAVHNWINEISRDEQRKGFISWIMDLKNSIPFKASQLLDMEHSPEMSHCTIFILYSSQEYIEAEIKEQRGIENLITGVHEMFHERCAVATVDMTYPPNYILFGAFAPAIGTTPALLFKNPVNYKKHVNLIHNIRLPEDYHTDEHHSFLSLNPNYSVWSTLKRIVEIKRDLPSSISELVEQYTILSKGKTIPDGIYQPHYKHTDELELYKNITQDMHAAYVDRIWNNAERTGMTYCHSNEEARCTRDEIHRENDKIELYMWNELSHFWSESNLYEEMKGFLKHNKRFESIDSVRMIPKEIPIIDDIFTTWLELHPPNQGYDEL